ncbi:MAG: acyl-CoA carboxylase subunit beta [Hyphomonadaceae bacterium]|nr:acyl-CoA carboxylase subunit beta [Hyphomonadaceae bacterium]
MEPLVSKIASSPEFGDNFAFGKRALEALRQLEARRVQAAHKAAPRFAKRGQLLPRARLALLVDSGAPLLELSSLAGFGLDKPEPHSLPGAGMFCGIGYVSGLRAMIVVDDAAIDAGAIQPMTIQKFQRAQDIALRERLPFIHLIESAGANLANYHVESFITGGRNFFNLARLSAAGIPVLGVVHGSSTAGGAYMTGLSDYVIMVRDNARAFLAGPPLLKAATGEIADADELGGAEMHAEVSGLAEYLAADDAEAMAIARDVCAALSWDRTLDTLPTGREPLYPVENLLGVMPEDARKPVDMREVIAHIVDGSEFLEFKALHGSATLCGNAAVHGQPIGIVTNNGPIDVQGANKATHFIQACSQSGTPLLYLQNTTGFLVGIDSERSGIIKHGSKMVQAVANAGVPQITVQCGASFGAGNYGMCGRGFDPNFLFLWPTARTGVMGAAQAAGTMRVVAEQKAEQAGGRVDAEALARMEGQIIDTFERQTSAAYTSARLLDDGVIDPRDTRRAVALALSVCNAARRRVLRPLSFGVGRA